MKTSWYIKSLSNKRVQLLHVTYDDESKDLIIKDTETNSKVVFFVENLKEFKNQLDKILHLITKIDPKEEVKTSKFGSFLQKVRLKYKNAYKPWSAKDDGQLKKMYLDGVSNSAIAKFFERGPGSINSRLKRLGLIEDEDVSELIE